MTHTVKNSPAMQETQVQSLGWEDPLEKGLITHSSRAFQEALVAFWRMERSSHRKKAQKTQLQSPSPRSGGRGVQGAGQLSPERESTRAPQRDRPRGQLF